jgi:hypothetical protein
MEVGKFSDRHTFGMQVMFGLALARVNKARYQHVHCSTSLVVVAAHCSIVEEIVVGENPVAPVAYRAKSVFIGKRSHDGREIGEITLLDRFFLRRRKLTRACHSQTLASYRYRLEESYLHTASSDSTRVLT